MKSFSLALSGLILLASIGMANEVVELQINSESSSVNIGLLLQTGLPGSLIGNYDEATNPEGTLTRPGLIGGSGNQPVDLDMTANLSGEIDSVPSGGFSLILDLEALSLTVEDFQVDVLSGQPGMLELTLGWDFETFRTFQPDSLFLGVPLTIPLGEGALTVLNLQQARPADTVQLVEQGPDHYSFLSLVPVVLTIESAIFGQPIAPPPIEIVVALNGELDVAGDQIIVTQTFEQMAGDELTDVPGGEYSDIPFPVPTILPPGFTANLLLSGDVESISFDLNLAANLEAYGEFFSGLRGDMNGDGAVNLLDVAPFVEAIVSGSDLQVADINCDGAVDYDDVSPFIDLLFAT